MATNPIFRYPLDPTGTNPDNRVAGETHTLPNRPVRGLAPNYGMFFTESLVITDVNTNTPLNSSQFRCVELQELPTARYGKTICAIILITDTSVSNNISLTYQPLGGTYSDNTDALIDMINNLDLENRPVNWPGILNRPDEFDPAPHFHDSGDIYGMEYVVHAINRLRQAILIGDEAAHDELRRYIDTFVTSMTATVTALSARVTTHESNNNNPHNTTKAQVQLGSVENYPIASQAQAEQGDSNVVYMTALRTKQAITLQAGNALNAHTNRTDNPHGTTKAQVNLGNVENYGIASQSQAEAGALDNVYMTALKVKQAITSQAIGPLNTHTARTDNPHGTTKAHVGLSDVLNYGMSPNTEAVAGISNAWYMSPLRVKEAITSQALGPLNTHTARTDNPHGTTKAHVGLNLVENYAMAIQSEAEAGIKATAYMSPLLVKQAITSQAIAPLTTHTNRTDNPHGTTAAQVGLGLVQNYGIAANSDATTGTNNAVYMTALRTKEAIIALATWTGLNGKPTTVSGFGISDAVTTARTVTAGVGLSGGGNLAADRIVSLGMPSTITSTTTNSVTGTTHTHAIDLTGVALPPGMVSAFAMTAVPAGWLYANGRVINISAAPLLFAQIGTRYGGNGTTTFGLPQTQGIFIRGWADGNGTYDPDWGRGLGSVQWHEIQSHQHTIETYARTGGGDGKTGDSGGSRTSTSWTLYTGGAETRPKNMAMKYCIYAGPGVIDS